MKQYINNLEIAIITYNRPDFIKRNLDASLPLLIDMGIKISIYDSSTNFEIESIVKNMNDQFNGYVHYHKLSSNTRVDDKVLISIINSDRDYIWPIADSVYLGDTEIFDLICENLNQELDYICVFAKSNLDNNKKLYLDSVSFFSDCFWHSTWLGGLIFRKNLFNTLLNNETYQYFSTKYDKNDGFSYLGIFYDLIANKKTKGIFLIVKFKSVGYKKEQQWLKRYLEVWCYNLCYFIDSIDAAYNSFKNSALRETWNILQLDKFYWNYKARLAGGLNAKIYENYDSMGYLDRVTNNKSIIRFCAHTPVFVLNVCNLLFVFCRLLKKIINKTKTLFYTRNEI